MAIVTIKVEGLKKIQEEMHKLTEDIQKKIAKEAVSAGAKLVKDQAIRNAPVGPGKFGHLRDSIASARMSKISKPGLEMWAVGVFDKSAKSHAKVRGGELKTKTKEKGNYATQGPSFYWKFVELGTVKMDKRAFLVPAFKETKEAAATMIIARLIERIEKAGGFESATPAPYMKGFVRKAK